MKPTQLSGRICAELNLQDEINQLSLNYNQMLDFFKDYNKSDFDHLQTYTLGFDLSSKDISLMKEIWNKIKKSTFKNGFTMTFVIMDDLSMLGPYRTIDVVSGRLCTNLRLNKF